VFNIRDFEPITGRVHQPPPVHQTFEGPNFVVCSFCPRKVDYHPLAVPVPYNHANVDSDELMFYVGGNYEARKGSGIGIGSMSLHPSGCTHGPQPGAVEASLGLDDPPEPDAPHFRDTGIELRGVVFRHSGRTDPLFSGFDLRIEPGQKVGLVGPSGGGKSTLTRLLLRFADVGEGTIEIGGQDIARVRQADLRRQIAYVPQDPLMFHRSLRDNIAFGRLDATEEEIEAAARAAHAADFIDALPEGYGTLVGERGIKLSGGQRQRLAIARAVLRDAPILVLDEATSSLDSESEALIQDALLRVMAERTAVVIAHRLSTVRALDRLVVLVEGGIVEDGTHDELLAHGGVYAHLWSRQSGGFLALQPT
jgi:ATP-binding cassette subfamily B protein